MKRRYCSPAELLVITIAAAVFFIGAFLSPGAWAADSPRTENGYAYTVITADKPVKLSVAKLEVTGGGTFKAGKNVTIETRKEDAGENEK